MLSEAGYADLLDAIESETGGTVAFSAVMYPTYAVVELRDGVPRRPAERDDHRRLDRALTS